MAQWLAVLALLQALVAGPHDRERHRALPETRAACHPLWVLDHGWHTGLVLRTADVPAGRLPVIDAVRHQPFVEIGWGDHDFYQAEGKSIGLALKALFWVNDSVLHVVGLPVAPELLFAPGHVKQLGVTPHGFERLLSALEGDTWTDAQGRPRAVAPALYGEGWFYLARLPYSLARTCNTWMGRRLQQAGLPVDWAGRVTPRPIMLQLRRLPACHALP